MLIISIESEWAWEPARRTSQGEITGEARGNFFKAVKTWIRELFNGQFCVVVVEAIEAKQCHSVEEERAVTSCSSENWALF